MDKNKNTFVFDPYDLDSMRDLMALYGDTTMKFGVNEIGEDVSISIFPEKIVVRTNQLNGWCRLNVYHHDGTREELFDGKWE